MSCQAFDPLGEMTKPSQSDGNATTLRKKNEDVVNSGIDQQLEMMATVTTLLLGISVGLIFQAPDWSGYIIGHWYVGGAAFSMLVDLAGSALCIVMRGYISYLDAAATMCAVRSMPRLFGLPVIFAMEGFAVKITLMILYVYKVCGNVLGTVTAIMSLYIFVLILGLTTKIVCWKNPFISTEVRENRLNSLGVTAAKGNRVANANTVNP